MSTTESIQTPPAAPAPQAGTPRALDHDALMTLLHTMVGEMGAVASAPLVLLGDQLGLYRSIVAAGSVSAESLAGATGTNERYVREWLANQSASGYVTHDPQTGEFSMTPEQAAIFADENSPVFLQGAFYSFLSLFADQPRLVEAFKSGEGVAWGDHHSCLFCGVEKFFKPSYNAHLLQDWIPAVDGAEAALTKGAKVADVGCGHAASTILMAKAFPNSTFHGYDFHEPSIEAAREAARKAGVTNVAFEVATAQNFPGSGYDFITFFDCLHDMGDPVGAARRVFEALAPGGNLMIVEPMAGDSLTENLNPVSRLYYAYSTQVCTPSAMSQEGGMSMGAQAGEARMRKVVCEGGFSGMHRVAETPFNLIYAAKK